MRGLQFFQFSWKTMAPVRKRLERVQACAALALLALLSSSCFFGFSSALRDLPSSRDKAPFFRGDENKDDKKDDLGFDQDSGKHVNSKSDPKVNVKVDTFRKGKLSESQGAQQRESLALGKDLVEDFQQCDRDCRWVYGFYDKSITGVRVDADGYPLEFGEHCLCTRSGEEIIGDLIRRSVPKAFDENFWCGNFSTSNVCAMNLTNGEWFTTTRDAVAEDKEDLHVLHCGACGACSSPDDLMVIWDTKAYITTKMTKCSSSFAMPKFLGGTHDLDALRTCLDEENITFDNSRSFFGPNGPTCMDCWTDDIQCDSNHCKLDCISKFIDPNNNGKYQKCLQCDENNCGPGFIKCAGANRRSSGIVSDIERVTNQLCTVGHFWPCSECNLQCKGDASCQEKCKRLASCQNPKQLVRRHLSELDKKSKVLVN